MYDFLVVFYFVDTSFLFSRYVIYVWLWSRIRETYIYIIYIPSFENNYL